MLDLGDNKWLVSKLSELPDFTNVEELFLDVETKRVFDHKDYGGLYPWKGDRIAGVSLTRDDDPRCYYVPVRHTRDKVHPNIPVDQFQRWLKAVLGTSKKWINHHIVFDAVFAHFDGAEFGGELRDTLTLSKVHDSDRMEHGLKSLCRDWVDYHIPETMIKALLEEFGTKSYADLPTDKMGLYACGDVRGNRKLYRYIQENRDAGTEGIWATEIALTAILYDMELEGLRVDPSELMIDRMRGLRIQIDEATVIQDIVEREFTNHHSWFYDVLINQLGYPVLATKWEKGKDTGKPTFDKEAMAMYDIHPMTQADPELRVLLNAIMAYRKEAQHQGLFVKPFLALKDSDNFIHPTYNQVIRTGRMSSSRPNAQQQNPRSKSLIHPREGCCFISNDYSQIEFRLIAHFIQDRDAIAAYNNDPNTDFHQWVADMVGIARKPGKTMNFRIGYGAGKRNVESALIKEKVIMEEVGAKVNAMILAGEATLDQRNDLYRQLCAQRASDIYEEYHNTLPGIKATSDLATARCRQRGYIFNPYGRRRHLPRRGAHKAFNSLVQGCAMDIIKERMVAVSPRYNPITRQLGIRMAANVHDEILFEAPIEIMMDPEVHAHLINTLESPSIEFRVPIKTGLGVSLTTWKEAAGDDTIKDGEKIIGGCVV